MIRHFARQLAVQTLYQMEVGQLGLQETIENITEMLKSMREEAITLAADDLAFSELGYLEEQFEIDEFYLALVNGTVQKLDALDAFIEKNISGWSLNRLNKVDKAILRLAAYELSSGSSVAPQVIINEALELTKSFSNADGKATAFNNKVLDQMKNSLENGQEV